MWHEKTQDPKAAGRVQGCVTLGRALLGLYVKPFMTWPRGLKCRLCNLCHNQLGTPSDTPKQALSQN